jgi:hypothetical protein
MKASNWFGLSLVLCACGGSNQPPVTAVSDAAPSPPPAPAAPAPAAANDPAKVEPVAAPAISAPATPDAIKAPEGSSVVAKVNAKGVQIYACAPKKDEPKKFEWTLKGPEAQLSDADGKPFGKHYAGPTWEAADGSKVVGAMKAKVDAPSATAVPWLLLEAKSTEGKGVLSTVAFVQRVDTEGGKAPEKGCDKAHDKAEVKVDYSANYYFYAAKAAPKP